MGVSMDGKKVRFFIPLFVCGLLACVSAQAAVIEISAMLAYSTSDFEDGYHSLQRRYTGTIDFKFTPVSALEFEYTDSTTRITFPTTLGGYIALPTRQVTNYKDQVYSFNWVQNLVSTKWILQPYFVIGGGKMHRVVTVDLPEYRYSEKSSQNLTTGTGGLGVRLFMTKAMAVKAEAKTYVPEFRFSKWKENQMLSLGLSWAF
ncbi:MAG TPA: outer membrane beta-barrel protein [Bdellovibrionota bacterium]|jgi:hypothetical protein